jgi:hypothetical protein
MPEVRESSPQWPATFAELNGDAGDDKACRRCHEKQATHSLTISVAKLGQQPGGKVATRRGRFCEACAVRIYGPVARALR